MTWQNSEASYLYDGSIEGYLTVALECIIKRENPKVITVEEKYRENLFDIPIYIDTKLDYSNRLINELHSISDWTLNNIYTVFLSGNENKEMILFKYIISVLKYKNKLNYMKNKECIIEVDFLRNQVLGEAHRLKGFLRFELIDSKTLYGEIEPDHNIIEFLANHFKKRLAKEQWIIYDKKRNILAAYSDNEIYYSYVENLEFKRDGKDIYQELWKKYFKTISIKERENKRCQLNFMPRRYWKNMIEVKEEY